MAIGSLGPTFLTSLVPATTSSVFSNGASIGSTQVAYGDSAGKITADSGFTRASLALTVDANTDNTLTTGYGKLGLASSGTSTSFYLAQASNYNSTDFALKQGSGGATVINAKSGQSVQIAVNGSAGLTVNTGVNVASGFQLAANDTTNATSLTTGCFKGLGGAGFAKNVIVGFGIHQGVTSTATAAGTTTLTATSTGIQIFTGSTTQTVQLPAANLFGAGVSVRYTLINRSSGNVSWQRAGSDTINGATSNVAVSSNTVGTIYSDGVSAWFTA